MLSATVENIEEFAGWVSRVKGKPMKVLKTYKRPVPLTHFVHHEESYEIKRHESDLNT
jgi:antiviral helicase SKI2